MQSIEIGLMTSIYLIKFSSEKEEGGWVEGEGVH